MGEAHDKLQRLSEAAARAAAGVRAVVDEQRRLRRPEDLAAAGDRRRDVAAEAARHLRRLGL